MTREEERSSTYQERLTYWRKLLRSRLAAERAALLRQLAGLERATLINHALIGEWTAKDAMAHVAAWDEFYTERTDLVLTNRVTEIEPVDLEAHNQIVFTERQDWPLDRVVESMLAARTAYLDALAKASDEELHRTFRLPFGDRRSLRIWARYRYQHDAGHRRDLAGGRTRGALEDRPGPPALLLALVRAGRKELLTAVALMPAEARAERRLQDRSLREALASRADAAGALRYHAEIGAAGAPHEPTAEAWEETWRRLHQVHQQLIADIHSMGEATLRDGEGSRWYLALLGYADSDRRLAAEVRRDLQGLERRSSRSRRLTE